MFFAMTSKLGIKFGGGEGNQTPVQKISTSFIKIWILLQFKNDKMLLIKTLIFNCIIIFLSVISSVINHNILHLYLKNIIFIL